MGTPYIYYINSSEQGGTYIGQSKGSESSFSRIISHFSGLYHYNDKGKYVNTYEHSIGEGAPFIDWLRVVPLDSIVTRVFYGPLFGIPKKIWIQFLSQWSTSTYHRLLDGNTKAEQEKNAWNAFLAMSDEAKLNAAEIIHIYNAQKRGYTLLQRQMGGQNLNLFKRGTNIVLNREMSPNQMVSIIDADEGAMSNFQQVFDKYFNKDVLHNPNFIKLLTADKTFINSLIDNPNAAYNRLKELIDNYLQSSSYGSTTVLEMLLNAVKDDCGHKNFFRFSWGKKNEDAISMYQKGRNENYNTFISVITNQLVRALKNLKDVDIKDFEKELEKMLKSNYNSIFVSAGTVLDIKLIVKYNGLDSFTPLGEKVDISSSLKRISYYYYAHFADMYYNRHSFKINDGHQYIDSEFNYYAKMKEETCTEFVYGKYVEEGIRTPYMENWTTWRRFNNGMLTIYTKNRGNAFLGNERPDPRILLEDEPNNQFVNTPAFIFHTELPFVDGIPFYEVSPATWNFVVSNSDMRIENLEIY